MLKLSKKSQIKLIITLWALISAHGVFAYGKDDYDSSTHVSREQQQVELVQESIKAVEEANKQAASESIEVPATTNKQGGVSQGAPQVNLQGLGSGNLAMAGNPEMMRKAIKMFSTQSKRMADSEVAVLIKTGLQTNQMVASLAHNKKFVNFAVGMIKDDNALLYLFELTQDKKTLKLALIVVVGLFVLSFFLKRILIKKDDPLTGKLIKRIFLFTFNTVIRLSALYFIYKDYLDPTIRVFKERVLISG